MDQITQQDPSTNDFVVDYNHIYILDIQKSSVPFFLKFNLYSKIKKYQSTKYSPFASTIFCHLSGSLRIL